MHMLMKPSPCAPSLGIKEGFVTNFAEFWHMELLQFHCKSNTTEDERANLKKKKKLDFMFCTPISSFHLISDITEDMLFLVTLYCIKKQIFSGK